MKNQRPSSRAGIGLVEILVGIALAGIVVVAASSLMSEQFSSSRRIEETLNFESAVDLVRLSLVNRKNCSVEFYNLSSPTTGTQAIATDHSNVSLSPAAVPAAGAYSDLNAIVRAGTGPLESRVLLRVGQDLGRKVIVTRIAIVPPNATQKILRKLSDDRYAELVKLEITAVDDKGIERNFSMLTHVAFLRSTGALDACFQENPTITTHTASRRAYLLNGAAAIPCNRTAIPSAALHIGAIEQHGHYKAWCDHNAASPAAVSAKVVGGDPACVVPTGAKSFKRNHPYVRNFQYNFPLRYASRRPSASPLYASEGRCWIDIGASDLTASALEHEVFVINAARDANPALLSMGCNASAGWSVASCTLGTDGAGGGLTTSIEKDAGDNNTYCNFADLQLNTTGFNLSTISINVTCARVQQ